MPWQERSAMEEREAFVAEYLTDLWTMTELCAVYGISRKTGHKWVARYEDGGRRSLADQSRRPHGHPHTIPERLAHRVLAVRRRFPRGPLGS
jgi:putative transposase